jgi:hypothetical protein
MILCGVPQVDVSTFQGVPFKNVEHPGTPGTVSIVKKFNYESTDTLVSVFIKILFRDTTLLGRKKLIIKILANTNIFS